MRHFENFQKLKADWLAQGIKINPGVSVADLDNFEIKYKVHLPKDFRDYFICMNGMAPNSSDADLIRFWKLEEVKPLSQEAPEYATLEYIKDGHLLFPFADYSIWSHTYCIRLSQDKNALSYIYAIGLKQPILLAESFESFFIQYCANESLNFLFQKS